MHENDMWQPRVETEGYFVMYFDRIATFEALHRRRPVKGGVYMRFVDA